MSRPEPTHDDFGRRLDLDEGTPFGEQETTVQVPANAAGYEALAEGLTSLNHDILASGDVPPLYDSGVIYHGKRRGAVWRNAKDTYEQHWGNCIDLASWRAAEKRISGEDPGAFVYVYRSGRHKFHAVVGHSDGTIEDPSYILGMRVPPGWRPITRVGETRYHGPGSPDAVEGIDMRTMDRQQDAYADDDTYDNEGEGGGFSDLNGIDMEGDTEGDAQTEGDEAFFASGDGGPDGDIDGPDLEGASWDEGEPNPWGNFPANPTGDADALPPGYDPNWDPAEGGVPVSGESDGASGDYTDGAGDAEGDAEGDYAEGDEGDPRSYGAGLQQGEDLEEQFADDPNEAGPEPEPTTEPPPPPPGKKRSLAKRIFHGARRAHSFARSLSPTHQLAKRIPGVRRFSKYILGEEPAIGIGPDCAPECGSEASFDVYRSGKGWSGVIRIPTDQGRALMMATSPSPTTSKAASKAVNMTRLAASSPALQAMVPPQAKLALMAAQHPVAKAAMKKLFRR